MYTKDLLDTCPYTTSVSLFQKLVSKFVINSLLKVFSAISAAAAKTWDSYVILTSLDQNQFSAKLNPYSLEKLQLLKCFHIKLSILMTSRIQLQSITPWAFEIERIKEMYDILEGKLLSFEIGGEQKVPEIDFRLPFRAYNWKNKC